LSPPIVSWGVCIVVLFLFVSVVWGVCSLDLVGVCFLCTFLGSPSLLERVDVLINFADSKKK
jgi:hypothetical protein